VLVPETLYSIELTRQPYITVYYTYVHPGFILASLCPFAIELSVEQSIAMLHIGIQFF
jgi:hypothetical protein